MTDPDLNIQGAGTVRIGRCTHVGADVTVIFHKPGTVTIGDCCNIGAGTKIICSGGDVTIGDWTSLHDQCLLLAGKAVHIGEHGWFGQHCVLDGTGGLVIGKGVRVGMYSQIWSHVAAGEQIEGCTLFGSRPVHIEDDVWLVGSCIVASGVTLGRKCVALIGSNITKSFPENTVLAGAPAQPKPGLSFYQAITPAAKWQLLRNWLNELATEWQLRISETEQGLRLSTADCATAASQTMYFTQNIPQALELADEFPLASICVLENKSYNKTLSDLECRVLKHLGGNKARFYASNWAKLSS